MLHGEPLLRISSEMVTPIVQEEEWIEALSGLPIWVPPISDTVVISPHPDDETLSVGGLLSDLVARGLDVRIIAVTDGENAYENGEGLAPIRQREQEAALAKLGIGSDRMMRLRLEDSGLHRLEAELVSRFRGCIQPGTHVIAPWPGDFHPDHEVCGRAAQQVAKSLGLELTFYFFWTWHRGTPDTVKGLPIVAFPLTRSQVEIKSEALECHSSQLGHISGEPILPRYLLEPMKRSFEVYLPS